MTRTKYGNIRIAYKGQMFDSKKEAEYAMTLDSMKYAHNDKDRVVKIEYQVPYAIVVKNIVIAKYLADFRVKYADGHEEVVDVKGMRTPLYILKKKLVEALHDIKIIEV